MVKVMATAAEQEKQKKAKEYEKYVKQVTPTHSLFKNMCRAFLCGGAICVLGQGIMNFCMSQGLDKEISGGWTSLILVLLSVLCTGFNIYPKIAKWGGAGTLVLPILWQHRLLNTRKRDRYLESDARFLS